MRESAIVFGAGDGLGSSLLRRFAQGGLATAGVRRNADALSPVIAQIRETGRHAIALSADAVDPASVKAAFDEAESALGPVGVCIYNVPAFARKSILEETSDGFRTAWEALALGAFHVGSEAARRMVPRKAGTIMFTGATASLKGSAGFASFAAGKFAQRALAQSMARELGPEGIHVAHVVIDGIIDGPRADPAWLEALGPEGALQANALAEEFWRLHQQPRSAWTFELDLRPFVERW